jgi:NDP-sugar pyrophosphorylase family protein
MIDVNGKPFLQYVIEEIKKYGITNIVLCVGYLADKVKGYFGDGKKLGVNIVYSVEKEYLGTAGALKQAETHLENNFFVLNGDTYLKENYADIYKDFKGSGSLGMMVVYDNGEKIAEENIAIDRSKMITAYGKKEQLKKGDQLVELKHDPVAEYGYIDAGVYVFRKDILKLIDAGKFVSLEGDVYPQLIKMKGLKAHVTSHRYYDLGTPERLELIRRVLK